MNNGIIGCVLCDKKFKNTNYYLASHLRKHKMKLDEYCIKFYKDLTPNEFFPIDCACGSKKVGRY